MDSRSLSYNDVFVPGGFPRHTYNPRVDFQLENKIAECTKNLCKLVVVTGHTKSGKTVLVKKVLPPESTVWIDGGTVSEEEDFWCGIKDQLEIFESFSETNSLSVTTELHGDAKASGSAIVVKAEGSFGMKRARNEGVARQRSKTTTNRVAALAGLKRAKVPLVIDDFHYIPKSIQSSLVRALKSLIFDGIPVVVIAIPHRRYDAIKVEKEMSGRVFPVEIPRWTTAELKFIPRTGFELLGYSILDAVSEELASQAIGSPHMMQDFCRTISRQRELTAAASNVSLEFTKDQIEYAYRDVAETIGKPIFEKLARGPRQRTDRLPRELKDKKMVDIYGLVLQALAHMRPGLVGIEYESLRSALREVSASQIPQLHEVARVLKHMATIAASDQSSTPVIEFDEEEKRLHVTDPFFAFFLRWGTLGVETE